jgi:hypothetical protein
LQAGTVNVGRRIEECEVKFTITITQKDANFIRLKILAYKSEEEENHSRNRDG